MTDDDDGTVTESSEGLYELRFEQRYTLPVETVWAALTEPARLNEWLAQAKINSAAGRFHRTDPGRR